MTLSVERVYAGYGEVQILHDVSMEVQPGQVVGVIGPNGAGKSTLLKTIFGYLRPSSGFIRYGDRDITGLAPEQILRRGVGFVPQARGVFPRMTVEENLVLGGFVLPRDELRDVLAALYERFPLFYERRRQRAGTLSGGERRLLEIARVMILDPQIILLDEPSAALAPKFVDDVYGTVVELNEQGTAFLVVEQNVDMLLGIADFVYALQLGANAHAGPPAEFRERAQLRRLFLGDVGGEDSASADGATNEVERFD